MNVDLSEEAADDLDSEAAPNPTDVGDDSLDAYMQIVGSDAAAVVPGGSGSRSRCVLITNVLTPQLAEDVEEVHMARMETGRECERWGRILRVHAIGAGMEPPPPADAMGRIFIEFEEASSAAQCMGAMDGRLFDGRRVSVTFYPEDAFVAGDFAVNADGGGGSSSVNGVGNGVGSASGGEAMEEEEDDDKDASFHAEFMRQVKAQAEAALRHQEKATQEVLEGRDDAMDALMQEFPDAAGGGDGPPSGDKDGGSESGNQAAEAKQLLAPVDHSQIDYAPFRKNFYVEAAEISAMSDVDVDTLRKSLDDVKVRGKRCPRPITRWTQCGLSDRILAAIDKAGYAKPFAIQAQSLPAVMSGRDVIAIAKTGSGKTMGYTLPMVRHAMDQRRPSNGEGPIALVMVPTRELAVQVHKEIHKLVKAVGLACAAVYGGANQKQQIAELKSGVDAVVCTPGRMIDMLSANSGRVTNLRRITYVVLDEADRMFDMGFAPQIDRILNNTRPDRQTLLFSATFPSTIEKLARSVLTKPVQIVAGGISKVSDTIEQHAEVLSSDAKLPRLCQLLREHYDEGQQLVFVDTQESCDVLFRELLRQSLPCATLHGGMSQMDRDSTIADFKSGGVAVLVATSVAARGLDVKGLICVINYEPPNHYEDYVHRVGRTGRAGNTGVAYTFLTPDEEKFAPDIVKAMEASGQDPPDEILVMANAHQAKRDAGELNKKDIRTSGFKNGRGVAMDGEALAEQERAKKAARVAAKRAAGVEMDDDGHGSDEDEAIVPTGQQLQKKFVTEYEINDFPNQARAKVVRKDFLDGIQELTGVVIICRGSYYPPGRNPPAGERKLYLLIESDSDVAVAEAQKELKRALQDVAATAAPALDGKYGKYRL